MASFLGLLETACGNNNAAPVAPRATGNLGNKNLAAAASTCTAKSCPQVKSFQLSEEQITMSVNEDFGNMKMDVAATGNDSNRNVKLFVDAANLVRGLKASPSGLGFTLSGKIGVPGSYAMKVFVRDLDSCKIRSKSNASSCETSDKPNTTYDKEDTISIAITAPPGEQNFSSTGGLPSSCAKKAPNTKNPLDDQTLNKGIEAIGSLIFAKSTPVSFASGFGEIAGSIIQPKQEQPQVDASKCY